MNDLRTLLLWRLRCIRFGVTRRTKLLMREIYWTLWASSWLWTENLCTYPVDIIKLPSKILEKKNQYLVYHPFASRTAATLLGIDSHRLSKKSPSMSWVQSPSRACARHLLTVSGPPLVLWMLGKCWCSFSFNLFQQCSIAWGLRSGELGGHSITCMLFPANQAIVSLAVCIFAPSCWKIGSPTVPSTSCQTSTKPSSKTPIYTNLYLHSCQK